MRKVRKVAVITGASQGIGAGLVAGYRQAGYAVVGVARSIPPSGEDDYVNVQGDIAQAETAERVVDQELHHIARGEELIADRQFTAVAWRLALLAHGLAFLGAVEVLIDPANGLVSGPYAREVTVVEEGGTDRRMFIAS